MIKYIILAIIIIAILSYFGFNLKSFVENDIVQNNFGYAWNAIKYAWNNFLARPADYLWNDIFVNLLWNPFVDTLQRLKAGKSPEMIEHAPQVPNLPNQR